MDRLPPLDTIPCPTCQAVALKKRTDAEGFECGKCGQHVIIEESQEPAGKRRNYTPGRGLRRAMGEAMGEAEAVAKALPPRDGRGDPTAHPLGGKAIFEPVTAPSHALESVEREGWMKRGAIVAVLAIMGS